MAIDFRLLNTPEARADAERRRKEREEMIENKEKIVKQMTSYLLDNEAAYNHLTEWERQFVRSVQLRVLSVGVLTDKQEECLTKIYSRF